MCSDNIEEPAEELLLRTLEEPRAGIGGELDQLLGEPDGDMSAIEHGGERRTRRGGGRERERATRSAHHDDEQRRGPPNLSLST